MANESSSIEKLFSVFSNENGIIIPDTNDIKERVISLFSNSLGIDEGMARFAESPLGRIIELCTATIVGSARMVALNSNNINPNYMSGKWLDAFGSFFGISRNNSTSTVVQGVILTGASGTVIPAGSLVSTENGDLFTNTENITIGLTGSISATFYSVEKGPIECKENSLINIVTAVNGWDGVTNQNPGSLGVISETDESFKNRILKSRAGNVGSLASINNSVLSLTDFNILDCNTVENPYNTTLNVNGLVIDPHSIQVIVDYDPTIEGATDAIAEAIFKSKTAGCGFSTQFEDLDTLYKTSNVVFDGITYPVSFIIPDIQNISVEVKIRTSSFDISESQIEENVKNIVSSYFSSMKIAQSVSVYEITNQINSFMPSVFIDSVVLNSDETISSIDILSYKKASLYGDVDVEFV